jgi:hypothetical protein
MTGRLRRAPTLVRVEVVGDLVLLPLALGVVLVPVREAGAGELGKHIAMAFDQTGANVNGATTGGIPFVSCAWVEAKTRRSFSRRYQRSCLS